MSSSLACSKAFSCPSMCLASTVAGALAVVLMTAGLRSTGGTDWCLLVDDTREKNISSCLGYIYTQQKTRARMCVLVDVVLEMLWRKTSQL